MTRAARFGLLSLLVFAPAGFGCGEVPSNTINVVPTPASVLNPGAPGASVEPAKRVASKSEPAAAKPEPTKADAGQPASAKGHAPSVDESVALIPVKYDELRKRIAANKKAKFTMVDVWSTTCPPCKENFPHVVAMNAKYADKGLAVVSLSFDDPTDTQAVAEARAFLREQKAVFTNYLLDEEPGVGNEKLDFNTLPAVFLFGPDGKELKRFTWDDPNKQFTYDEVEKEVVALLGK